MEKRVNKKGTVSYWENGVMVMKECTKCKVIKGVESFNKRKNGLRHHCKECQKQEYQDNIEHRKEKARENYLSNKEHKIKKMKQYREKNKERLSQQQKEYREKNKEKIRHSYIQWRERHQEYYTEYHKRYRESNRERINENSKYYRENDKIKNIKTVTDILNEVNPLFKEKELPVYGMIYKFENVKTGRCYIGQTIRPLSRRYPKGIVKGWIENRQIYKNQKYINELIEEDIKVTEVLDVGCCQYHLDKLEVYYINKYNSLNNGYNINAGHHKTEDGKEEFIEILKNHNIEFSELDLISGE